MTSTPPLLPPARSTRSQRTERDGSPVATVKPEAAAASVKTDTTVSSPQVLAAPTSIMGATINDPSLTPPLFSGAPNENGKEWLTYFFRYITFQKLSESGSIALFALLIKGTADTLFSSLSDADRANFQRTTTLFEAKYAPAPISLWRRASELWSRDQKPQESVEEFYFDMTRRANEVNATADMTRYALMRGLRPVLRTYVLQQNPTTVSGLLDAAKIAEATIFEAGPSVNTKILEAINRLENKASIDVISDNRQVRFNRPTTPKFPRSPTPTRRDNGERFDSRQREYRGQLTSGFFARRPMPRNMDGGQPTAGQQRQNPMRPSFGRAGQQMSGCMVPCVNCNRIHGYNECLARTRNCHGCGQVGHFVACCRNRQQRE